MATRIPPSAVGDRLYVPLDDGRLLALALLTGNPLWERTLGGTPGRILALEDRLYVGSRDKFLYCLSPADGSTRWRWRAGAEMIGQAVVDSAWVFFTARDNTVRALDRRTGNQRWKRALTLRPSAAPVPFAGVIVVSGLAAELRGFRASDGTPAGVFAAPADVAAAPHAADVPRLGGPVLILLIGDGRLVAVRPAIDPVLRPPPEAILGEPAPNDGPLEPPPVPLDWMPGAPLPPESEIPPHRVSGPEPNLPQGPL
jgi:outer membrane protein assembly factor BamB